jgi:hypothetical protein
MVCVYIFGHISPTESESSSEIFSICAALVRWAALLELGYELSDAFAQYELFFLTPHRDLLGRSVEDQKAEENADGTYTTKEGEQNLPLVKEVWNMDILSPINSLLSEKELRSSCSFPAK